MDKPESQRGETKESIQYFGTSDQVVEKYTHCGICGAHLHFNHITDFSRNITQETAKCPECGVKARQVLHRLQ